MRAGSWIAQETCRPQWGGCPAPSGRRGQGGGEVPLQGAAGAERVRSEGRVAEEALEVCLQVMGMAAPGAGGSSSQGCAAAAPSQGPQRLAVGMAHPGRAVPSRRGAVVVSHARRVGQQAAVGGGLQQGGQASGEPRSDWQTCARRRPAAVRGCLELVSATSLRQRAQGPARQRPAQGFVARGHGQGTFR